MMALEIAIDEWPKSSTSTRSSFAHPQRHPGRSEDIERRFSQRQLNQCLRLGADRFGWSRSMVLEKLATAAGSVGIGVAAAFRNNLLAPSGARVRPRQSRRRDGRNRHDRHRHRQRRASSMQTAAEMMGVPLKDVTVRQRLGISGFLRLRRTGLAPIRPRACTCDKLREAVASKLGFNSADAMFADGFVLLAIAASGSPRRPAKVVFPPRTKSNTAIWTRSISNRLSARISSKSRSMPQPADSPAPHALPCAPPGASSIRSRRAAPG